MDRFFSFSSIESGRPVDVSVNFGGFASTEVVFTLVSDRARSMFGGAVSFTTAKSEAMGFGDQLVERGLRIA